MATKPKHATTATVQVAYSTDDFDRPEMHRFSLRMVQSELDGVHHVDIAFPTRAGGRTRIRVPKADLDNDAAVMRVLTAHNVLEDAYGGDAKQIVHTLRRGLPKHALILTAKPGWRDDARGLVMSKKMYGSAAGRYLWDKDKGEPAFGAIVGNFESYRTGVLQVARQSSFMTVAIAISLAPSLLGYVRARCNVSLIPETALVHLAGPTSSGKTTLARIIQSVIGDPGALSDYRSSPRDIAEAAHARNDLVVLFDEAEFQDLTDAQLHGVMKLICGTVTAGRSRGIARAARGAYPSLTWTSFGISTGPVTQAAVTRALSKNRFGQEARFIDVVIPHSSKGGIFDNLIGDGQRPDVAGRQLVERLEACIAANHGALFDRWVEHLIATDVSKRAVTLTRSFARELAGATGGLEGRLAQKVGLFYAAAILGIEAGILPWTRRWVKKAFRRFYQNAREARDRQHAVVDGAIRKIARVRRDHHRFPRFAESVRGIPVFQLSDRMIGFVLSRRNGAREVYVLPNRLHLIGVEPGAVQKAVMDRIAFTATPGESTTSQQIRVKDPEHGNTKIRVWRIDPKSIEQVVARVSA